MWLLLESFQHEKILICDYFLYKGIANESKKLYGAQFHPEVGLTENGKVILKNFLYDIAGCSGTFTVQNRELECIREIKERVGASKVLVSNLLSRSLQIYINNGGIQELESSTQPLNVL